MKFAAHCCDSRTEIWRLVMEKTSFMARLPVVLILLCLFWTGVSTSAPIAEITIDGDFSDWEGITGVTDETGDISKPGTDVAEIKFAHDDSHVYALSKHAGPIESEDAGSGQGRLYHGRD